MNLNNYEINYELLSKYNIEDLKSKFILPFYEDDITVYLSICSESKLENIDKRFSKLIKYKEFKKEDILFVYSDFEIKKQLYLKYNQSFYNNDFEDKNIEEFVNILFAFAIEKRVSDIHIENYKNRTLFRFRIDGKLKTFFVCSKQFLKLISSYLKLLSNLDITQTRLPMDSRFDMYIDSLKYDFRLSTMPTLDNESLVIRILDHKTVNKDLESLGFSKDIFINLKEHLKLNQGLILVAGPTGSGKTTTLYSMLNELKSNEKKIITIEDPIEYKIDSISQIQVNSKIGLTLIWYLKIS